VKLGNPQLRAGKPACVAAARRAGTERADARAFDLRGYIESARIAGKRTRAELAGQLNAIGVPTPRGAKWTPMTVLRVERRLSETTTMRNDDRRRAARTQEQHACGQLTHAVSYLLRTVEGRGRRFSLL
jgi:hypothetical protein